MPTTCTTHTHTHTPQVKTLADHVSRGGKATLKTKYIIYVCVLSSLLSSLMAMVIVFDYNDIDTVILIHIVLALRIIIPTIVYLSTATADGIVMLYRMIKSIIICSNSLVCYNYVLCGVINAIMTVFNYAGNNMVILIHVVLVLRTINPMTVYLSTATASITADGIIAFYWLIDAVIICAISQTMNLKD